MRDYSVATAVQIATVYTQKYATDVCESNKIMSQFLICFTFTDVQNIMQLKILVDIIIQ